VEARVAGAGVHKKLGIGVAATFEAESAIIAIAFVAEAVAANESAQWVAAALQRAGVVEVVFDGAVSQGLGAVGSAVRAGLGGRHADGWQRATKHPDVGRIDAGRAAAVAVGGRRCIPILDAERGPHPKGFAYLGLAAPGVGRAAIRVRRVDVETDRAASEAGGIVAKDIYPTIVDLQPL